VVVEVEADVVSVVAAPDGAVVVEVEAGVGSVAGESDDAQAAAKTTTTTATTARLTAHLRTNRLTGRAACTRPGASRDRTYRHI
ncbi:hypothetical protein ACFLQ7_04015, partial [Actinomycetota bacterium]